MAAVSMGLRYLPIVPAKNFVAVSPAMVAQVKEIEARLKRVEASRSSLSHDLHIYSENQRQARDDLRTVVGLQPLGVRLTSIDYGSSLVLKGTAENEEVMLEYGRVLRSCGRFPEVLLSSVESSEGGGLNFTLILE